jgi:hypothetical protein
MACKTNFAFEIGVPLNEKVEDSVRFISDNAANVLSICTLVEKNILCTC